MKTKAPSPPKFFVSFFRWYCHPRLAKSIEGDLMELYHERIKNLGKHNADFKFIIDVILLFRPGIIRPAEGYGNLTTYGMYKSYLKIGWRNLLRNKGYSIINIGGLAIGMTVAILNSLWIWDEFSYDKSFTNYDRIAQVSEVGLDFEKGGTWLGTTMTYPLATELIENYRQQFKHIARSSWNAESIVSAGDVKLSSKGLYVDKDLPEMFTFKMTHGTRAGLIGARSILISESLAHSLFGDEEPIHRMLRIGNKTDVIITGVFEDFAQNTKLNGFQFFAPWSLFMEENKWIEQRALTDWRNHFLKIFVEIPEGTSFQEVNARVKNALQFDPVDLEDAKKRDSHLFLYPMSEWHLHPPGLRKGEFEPVFMIKLVGAIGLFVLLLACINFVNLSTARAEKRSKEVGIRKTIGSVRGQLISQFFSESFLVVFCSSLLAIVLTSLFLPGFNIIASKTLAMPLANSWFWLAVCGFVVVTSIMAGGYPALYLSSFKPVKALKGTFRVGRLASLPRKVLVVFQFSISVVLIICTVVVYQQIQFAKNRPIGYEQDGLIMLRKSTNDFSGKYNVLRNELKNTGVVYEVSESMGPVTDVYSGNGGWDWKGHDPNTDQNFATLSVSHLHGKTVGWKFVKGRDFDLNLSSDSLSIVINEAALRLMKLQEPLGEPVTWTWWMDKSKVLNYKIIGVIKDMVMESPYAPALPTIFYLKGHNGDPSWINIKIRPEVSVGEALPKIASVFNKIIPTVPFEYKFADQEYALKFAKEERIGNLAGVFALLAILISCLGLLGLASFVAETRTKEIGIRKVLGASVVGLWRMLSKDFVWLVLIACIVSAPLAYYLMSGWLEKFVYRTHVSIWVFIATGIGAIGITLLTISFQAITAAMANPVKSLRSE
ncbi:MAG TPA: ABC transporter permease [Cyclobacteriaceae bacterium]|nr:ABC transporter permease [Cyclobacteriaceae bacterium]